MSWILGSVLLGGGALPFIIAWSASKNNMQVSFSPKWLIAGAVSFVLGIFIFFLDNDFILGIIFLITAIAAFIYSGFYIKSWLSDQKHPGFLRSGGVAIAALFALILGFTGIMNGGSKQTNTGEDNRNLNEIASSESKKNEENNAKANSAAEKNNGKADEKLEASNKKYSNLDKLNKKLSHVAKDSGFTIMDASYNNTLKSTVAYVSDDVSTGAKLDNGQSLKNAYIGLSNTTNKYVPYPENANPKYIIIKDTSNNTIARTGGFSGDYKYVGD